MELYKKVGMNHCYAMAVDGKAYLITDKSPAALKVMVELQAQGMLLAADIVGELGDADKWVKEGAPLPKPEAAAKPANGDAAKLIFSVAYYDRGRVLIKVRNSDHAYCVVVEGNHPLTNERATAIAKRIREGKYVVGSWADFVKSGVFVMNPRTRVPIWPFNA